MNNKPTAERQPISVFRMVLKLKTPIVVPDQCVSFLLIYRFPGSAFFVAPLYRYCIMKDVVGSLSHFLDFNHVHHAMMFC